MIPSAAPINPRATTRRSSDWADAGPSDCDQCDGFGVCWNNADPTSGQWAPCPCGDTRGHP